MFTFRDAFIQCYKKEFEKRRDHYLEQKAKKEELFREIEQLKTSKRLIENKLSKSKKQSKAQFPLKVEVNLSRAFINDKKEINEKLSRSEDLGLSFKVDNGKEYFDSVVVGNLDEPRWTDNFQMTIMSEAEIIFFQLVLSDKNSDTKRIIDSFDLRGTEILNGIDASKSFKDVIITNSGNEYHIAIKKKGDEFSKLKAIEKKIEAKTATYQRLNQLHAFAKESMEKLISKKGMDLIKEWGFMSQKSKPTPNTKAKVIKKTSSSEEEKSFSTPKKTGKSFMPRSEPKGPKTGFLGVSADPTRFKNALEKSKEKSNSSQAKTPKRRKSLGNKSNKSSKASDKSVKKVKVDLAQTKGLNAESLRKDGLKRGRGGLASSLIGFSIDDVTRTHRVKSEFNVRTDNTLNAGQMFSCLDATMKIGGLLGEDLIKKEANHDDRRSSSALSFVSGGLFSPMNNSISGLSLHNWKLGEDNS